MKKTFWKWCLVLLVSFPVGFYTAFVAQCFWNWFAAPVLHIPEISFLQMLGILWLIQLLTSKATAGDDGRWELLFSVIELCVPQDKLEELKERADGSTVISTLKAFTAVFGQIVGNTLTLVFGFVLHVAIS